MSVSCRAVAEGLEVIGLEVLREIWVRPPRENQKE